MLGGNSDVDPKAARVRDSRSSTVHEPVDLRLLRERDGGDELSAARAALEHAHAARVHAANGRRAAMDRDLSNVVEAAHRLSGLLGLLGATRAMRANASASRAARIGSWRVAAGWLEEIEAWLAVAHHDLEAVLARRPTAET